MTYQDQLYLIAEEAHKGASETYIQEMCDDTAIEFHMPVAEVYHEVELLYLREFA